MYLLVKQLTFCLIIGFVSMVYLLRLLVIATLSLLVCFGNLYVKGCRVDLHLAAHITPRLMGWRSDIIGRLHKFCVAIVVPSRGSGLESCPSVNLHWILHLLLHMVFHLLKLCLVLYLQFLWTLLLLWRVILFRSWWIHVLLFTTRLLTCWVSQRLLWSCRLTLGDDLLSWP